MIFAQNVVDTIIRLQGVDVIIKQIATDTNHTVRAAITNYFRNPLVDEQIEASGRQYVISNKNLTFTPKRGDRLTVSSSQYFSIADVREMVAFGKIVGYRLVLK